MGRLCLLLPAALLIGLGPVYGKDENRDSVVKIHATHRFPDFARPWTKASPRKSAGSGVVIEGKRILTNAHVVQYASQIFVQADQSTEKIPATVVAVAPGIDLALLQVEEEGFFDSHRALPLADKMLSIKDTVNVYGYPIGGEQLSVTKGIISRIEYTRFYYLTMGVRIQVDAALNPGNSGGPAVTDGQIAGLVFSSVQRAENIGYLVAAEEIRMFLDDVEDGHYDGKRMMFDQLQTVENEALRAWLGLAKGAGGVMVTKPYEETEDYPLKEWDVITHIGDHEIDSQGNVRVKDDLRLAFAYFIPGLVEQGAVPLTVLRDGKQMKVDLPLGRERGLVMPFLNGEYPRYFICGPMVFTSATQELTARMGAVGQAYLKAFDNPLLRRQLDKPAFEGEEIVVLAARLFPHKSSKGYGNLGFAVVSQIDGKPVRNLAHLVETLRDASSEFITVKFHGRYETLVFRRKELIASTEEILDNEGIRNQFSEDLGKLWRKEG